MAIAWPAQAVAAVSLIGGLVGYLKAGSLASLGFGLGYACILYYSSTLIGSVNASSQKNGYGIAAATALVMTLLMGQRYTATSKFMPAGLIASMSGLLTVWGGINYFSA